ncbi:MAG: N-acetyltransferase family protein [Weeksellaceae bacterium]
MNIQPQEITTKTGKNIVIRLPNGNDSVAELAVFINALSHEDTYITFSGEVITLEEETVYMDSVYALMEKKHMVKLTAWDGDRLVGTCDISRMIDKRKRGAHIGRFGLTIAKDYRGEGLGLKLAQATIEAAKQEIPGLKIIILDVYEPNETAINLYKKLGFTEYGRLENGVLYKGQYFAELQMKLDIE